MQTVWHFIPLLILEKKAAVCALDLNLRINTLQEECNC